MDQQELIGGGVHTIEVSDDLTLEIHPGSEDGRPMLKLRSRDAMIADEVGGVSGTIEIWPEEILPLMNALAEAATLLSGEAMQ